MLENNINSSERIPSPWTSIFHLVNRYWFFKHPWRLARFCQQRLCLLSLWLWRWSSGNSRYLQALQSWLNKHSVKYDPMFSFLKALIINPRATGAVLPSSRFLVREMVSHVAVAQEGVIVELGAGTGVITKELLRSNIDPKRIIAVEYAQHLAKKLRQRYPEICVIHGNAANLQALLQTALEGRPVTTILSGLPLRSLPNDTAMAVLQQIPVVLQKGGKYIQFTYDLKSGNTDYQPDNSCLSFAKKVWFNIPPAKVDVFTRI